MSDDSIHWIIFIGWHDCDGRSLSFPFHFWVIFFDLFISVRLLGPLVLFLPEEGGSINPTLVLNKFFRWQTLWCVIGRNRACVNILPLVRSRPFVTLFATRIWNLFSWFELKLRPKELIINGNIRLILHHFIQSNSNHISRQLQTRDGKRFLGCFWVSIFRSKMHNDHLHLHWRVVGMKQRHNLHAMRL